MSSDANATFRAHYYDGRSAVDHKVVVRLSTNMLVISDKDGVLANWSYMGLVAPQPVSAKKTSRLAHEDAPSARLVVEDPNFAESILGRAPQLSHATAHRRSLVIATACFGVAAALFACGYVLINFAPRLVAGILPDGIRHSLGEQIEVAVVGDTRECTNAPGVAALEALRERLSVGDAEAEAFSIAVYDFDFVNAFALPGGKVVVSGELLETQSGADAVAGVMAHEFGHVLERDSETQIVRLLGISAITEAFFGGSSQLGSLVGDTAAFLTLMQYSREAERNADAHAVALLRQAEVDFAGLLSFFQYVRETYGDLGESEFVNLFSSHPGLGERIARLEELEPWTSQPALSAQQWADLQAICTQEEEAEREEE